MTRHVIPDSPRLLMVVLAGLTMVGPFSIDTYLPSFPAIAADLHASPVQMQQTLSVYMGAFAVMTLVYGPVSDAFGRRPVLLVSAVAYLLSSIACMFADSIESLIALRAVQGLAAASGLVVGRAVVRDAFEGSEARQVMSNIIVIFLVAPAFAPVIGGLLEEWLGWRSVFGFLALLAVLMLLLIRFGLPETLPRPRRQSGHPVAIARVYLFALRRPIFMLPVLMSATSFGAFFIYISAAPTIVYDHLHLGVNDFGYYFIPIVAAMMAGAWLAGRTAKRVSVLAGVLGGSIVMLAAAVWNAWLGLGASVSLASVLGPVMLYIFGLAFTIPAITVLILDQLPNNRGMASAVQSFTQTAGNALVAGLVVPMVFASYGQITRAMLILNLAGLLLGAAWWLRYRSELRLAAAASDRPA